MIRLRNETIVAIFFILIGVVFASVFPYSGAVANPNENTRTYMTMALVDEHTFRIDEQVSIFGHESDMALVPQADGTSHYYSAKGPANAYAGVPVYWAMRKFAPLFGSAKPDNVASIEDRAAWLKAVTFVLRFFTVQIPCFIFLIWFERWLRSTSRDIVLRLSAVLGAGLGTNYLAYSLMFVSHALFAVATFVAFALTLDQWRKHSLRECRSACAAFVVGFCAGWAVLLEYQALPVAVVLVIFAACIFWRAACLFAMSGGGAVHIAAMMVFQWRAFGSPFTPGHKFAEEAGAALEHSRGIYGITTPSLGVLMKLCFNNEYGFFGTSPYMFLGLLAIPCVVFLGFGKPRGRLQRRVATIVWVTAMISLFVLVTGKMNWHGGWSIGPRYYGAAPPFFAFGAVASLECIAKKSSFFRSLARIVAVGLAMASVAQTGLISIIDNTIPDHITRPFAEVALPFLMTGFVPHNIFELVGWKTATPFYFITACLAMAALLPLLLRVDNESRTSWTLRFVATLGVAAFALVPAFGIPGKKELDRSRSKVASLSQTWEPSGRDAISIAQRAPARLDNPCMPRQLAAMEKLVGRTKEAALDDARSPQLSTECRGLESRLEETLNQRLTELRGEKTTEREDVSPNAGAGLDR